MAESTDRAEAERVEHFIDRYWFLVRKQRAEDAAAGTVVIRDGAFVVVSVAADALGWPEGTLLFRIKSETTPCAGCVDRAMAFARRWGQGPLTPNGVRDMLRFAVARCAAWGPDPAHARAAAPLRSAGGARLPPSPRGERRCDAELWLVL